MLVLIFAALMLIAFILAPEFVMGLAMWALIIVLGLAALWLVFIGLGLLFGWASDNINGALTTVVVVVAFIGLIVYDVKKM